MANAESDLAGLSPSPIRLLSDAAMAVHGTLELHDKLDWVLRAVSEFSGASFAAFAVMDGEVRFEAMAGDPTRDAATLAESTALLLLGEGRRTREVVRGVDVGRLPRRRDVFARGARLASWLGVAVPAADGSAHGALVIGHVEPDRFGVAAEEATLALAAHLGVAMDNLAMVTKLAELEAVQREAVHQLQDAVRPPMPEVEGVELGVHYLPADPSSPTGGDLYDWLVLPDGDLHFAVVDVMGKGVSATKEALAVTHVLRLLVLDGCPIDELVARADALVVAQSPDIVATLVTGRYSPTTGLVTLVGAGHPPPLLVSPEGSVRYVDVSGVPIGYPGAASHGVVALTLQRWETLVFYTDGLIEATKDILVGLESLSAAAAETARYPAEPMARALVERALAGAVRRDDSVALVLRRRTPPPPTRAQPLGPFEYRFSPMPASVPLVRHVFSDWLEHLAIDREVIGDLVLVASELCANAVAHASGVPGALRLRAWPEDNDIVIEVEDDGIGFEWPDRYDDDLPPDPDAERGRGLFLVESLADSIDVRREMGRTIVQVRKRAVLSTTA